MSYGRIERRIWNSRTYKSLSDDGKMLWIYLLTCPHGNMLGLFVLKTGYALEDLDWELERFTKAFAEVLGIDLSNGDEKGLIKYDQENKLVWIKYFLEHNPITNPNQIKAANKKLKDLPKSLLYKDFMDYLKDFCKGFKKGLYEPLIKALGEGIPKPVAVTGTGAGSKQDESPSGQPSAGSSDKRILPGEHFSSNVGGYFDSIIRSLTFIDRLRPKKKFNHYMFTQHFINNKVHPGALDETLQAMVKGWNTIDEPWAWGRNVIKTKSGNWYERENIRDYQEVDRAWGDILKNNKKLAELVKNAVKSL